MKNHVVWMIVGCGLPLLLIFFAPALGISGNVSLFIFIVAMFACHLLMPMHHGGHNHGSQEKHSETSKNKINETHKH